MPKCIQGKIEELHHQKLHLHLFLAYLTSGGPLNLSFGFVVWNISDYFPHGVVALSAVLRQLRCTRIMLPHQEHARTMPDYFIRQTGHKIDNVIGKHKEVQRSASNFNQRGDYSGYKKLTIVTMSSLYSWWRNFMDAN